MLTNYPDMVNAREPPANGKHHDFQSFRGDLKAAPLTITNSYRRFRFQMSGRPPELASQKGGRGLALTPLGSDPRCAREAHSAAHLLGHALANHPQAGQVARVFVLIEMWAVL